MMRDAAAAEDDADDNVDVDDHAEGDGDLIRLCSGQQTTVGYS